VRLDEHLVVIRVIFYKEDEESGEEEGENAGTGIKSQIVTGKAAAGRGST
jgi:hypothetical protein